MRFNFTEAMNKIMERRKTAKVHVKKDIDTAKISLAPPQDRRAYLAYCIRALDEVSSDIFRQIPDNRGYTRKSAAQMLRRLLILSCLGHPTPSIARDSKMPVEKVENLLKIAVEAVKEAIAIKTKAGIPILGG